MAGLPSLARREAEAGAQVDRRDDPPTQVQAAGDLGRRQRDARDRLEPEHVPHHQHGHAAQLACDGQRQHHGGRLVRRGGRGGGRR
jgi:hypothetical protein